MHGVDGLRRLGATGDIGLVGDDEKLVALALEILQRLGNAGEDFQVFEFGGGEGLAIADDGAVDDAVAVEEDGAGFRHGGHSRASLDRTAGGGCPHMSISNRDSSRDGLPFGGLHFDCGVRDEQVPDDGLEGFGMRSDVGGIDGGDEDAGVGDGGGVASVAADDADDFCADGFGVLERGDEIGADVLFEIAAADGEDQEQVVGAEAAGAQPAVEDRGPAFIVGSGGEVRDVGGGGVGFDAGNFAEVVDGVGSVGGAAADAEDEEASSGDASGGEKFGGLVGAGGGGVGGYFFGFGGGVGGG